MRQNLRKFVITTNERKLIELKKKEERRKDLQRNLQNMLEKKEKPVIKNNTKYGHKNLSALSNMVSKA